MTKRNAAITAFVTIAIPVARAIAQTLSPTPEFEGTTTTPTKDSAPKAVHISVQAWGIAGQRDPNGPTYEIPLRGFYLAHLLNGHISKTIDGQTAKRSTGDYWTVKAGAAMQVKVFGEYAVLETTVVAKQ